MNPQKKQEAKRLFDSVKIGIKKIKKAEVVICPPFVYLPILGASAFAKGFGGFRFGSQDCFWEESGAYTGEISALMLKDIGCQYVIIGHSERRRYFGETDETVNKKLKAAIEANLIPIFCIGETQKQRDRGETENVLKKQIEEGIKNVSSFKFQSSRICIAYEPVWAIGTGKACDVEEAQKMGLVIRKIIFGLYGSSIAEDIRILYGGSVNSKNAAGYIREAGFRGLLVGGASLDAEEFSKIIKSVE